MKNLCTLLVLFSLSSYGQDPAVFKANHIKSSVSLLNNQQRVDSCEYNENGMLIFCRIYNLFKENDFEDKRYTYNSVGKQTKCVSYNRDGLISLTDTTGYDSLNRLISEKVYNEKVLMDKQIRYTSKERIDIFSDAGDNVCIRTFSKGKLVKEVLYRDTAVVEQTEYAGGVKTIKKGYMMTRDNGTLREVFVNGVLIISETKSEKTIYEPLKKEMTVFNENGLKEQVNYYQDGKCYQHLQYVYRR